MEGKEGGESAGTPRAAVAVAVFIVKEGSLVLLGERLSPVGRGTFALPGGRLEFGESFEECCAREVMEETGLNIKDIEVLTVVSTMSKDPPNPFHFVTILFRAALVDPKQEPENLEPDKCSGWNWFDWNDLPEPLFEPLKRVVQDGFSPFAPSTLMTCSK